MAKIVPQGYANINAYDEGDNYLKLLEYIDRYGEVRRDISSRRDESLGTAFDNLLGVINTGAIDSEVEYDKFHGEYTALMDEVDKSDNLGLQAAYKSLGSIMEGEKSSIQIFEKGFESISQQMTNTTDLLHRDSEIWNHDYISSLGADDINDLVTKFDTMAAQVGYDPKTGKIQKRTGYTKNGVNISQIENHLKFGQNRLKNVEEGLRNKLSKEEWEFIRSNPTNIEFDTVRESNVNLSKDYIKEYDGQIVNYNKLLNLFQERKDTSILEIIDYGMQHGVTGAQEMSEFAFGMAGDVPLYNQFMQQNPQLIASNGAYVRGKKKRLKELKAKIDTKTATQGEMLEYQNNPLLPTEEKMLVIADMYDDMIRDTDQKLQAGIKGKEKSLEKYNFWSETPFDLDVAEPNLPKENVSVDDEIDSDYKTYMEQQQKIERDDDADGDVVLSPTEVLEKEIVQQEEIEERQALDAGTRRQFVRDSVSFGQKWQNATGGGLSKILSNLNKIDLTQFGTTHGLDPVSRPEVLNDYPTDAILYEYTVEDMAKIEEFVVNQAREWSKIVPSVYHNVTGKLNRSDAVKLLEDFKTFHASWAKNQQISEADIDISKVDKLATNLSNNKEVKEELKKTKVEEKKKEVKKEDKKEEKSSLEMSLDEFANSINNAWDAKRYTKWGDRRATELSQAARNYKNNPNEKTKKKLEYFYNKYVK